MLHITKVHNTVISDIKRRSAKHFDTIAYQLRKHKVDTNNLDPFAEYTDYILHNGTYTEKGEFIQGINSTFAIHNQEIATL